MILKNIMTEKQKEEYITMQLLRKSPLFINDSFKINELKSLVPPSFFKFRKFDKYTFDMIDNNYVYLADAKNLDDPFDCLTTSDINEIIDKSSNKLTESMFNFIIDILCKSPVFKNEQANEGNVKKNIRQLLLGGGANINIAKDQANYIKSVLKEFNTRFENFNNQPRFIEALLKLAEAKDNLKVCSLTTQRDNKVLWSLYANTYKGYCVEYEIPEIDDISILLPVLYKRKKNFNIVKALTQFHLESIINKDVKNKSYINMACLAELICSKDIDWKYQDERRILTLLSNRCDKLKIKAIYLGFDVSKRNEQRVMKRAMKLKFNVRKMLPPSGSNELTYKNVFEIEVE